jgi:ferredoxin
MRVVIDNVRCQGHNRCMAIAPDVFGTDDLGYGVVIADGSVSAARVKELRQAAANCPESAISLVEDDRGEGA